MKITFQQSAEQKNRAVERAKQLNPRYVNYARAHGRTGDAMMEHDREAWPGGVMTGFMLWHRERLNEAQRENPEWFLHGNLVKQAEYDLWLTAWVDAHGTQGGKK